MEQAENDITDVNVKIEPVDIKLEVEEYMPWLLEPSGDWNIAGEKKPCKNEITPGHVLKKSILCKCTYCGQVFGDCYALLQHNLLHLELKLTNCDSLVKTKYNSQTKQTRTKQSSNLITKTPQYCGICDKTLTYKTWHTHMREIHSALTLSCNKCPSFFTNKRSYRNHLANVHGDQKLKTKHRNTKTELDLKECPKCNAVLSNKHSLRTHIRNVHSGEGKTIQCKLCNSKLKSNSYLLTHMLRVHYDDGNDYPCEQCGKKFKSPRYLKIHIKNSHKKSDLKKLPKKHCDNAVSDKEDNVQCNICGVVFNGADKLEFHKNYVHSDYGGIINIDHGVSDEMDQLLLNSNNKYNIIVREIKIEEL